jgi:hypothetical protein
MKKERNTNDALSAGSTAPAEDAPSPARLCLSLWLEGFLNAGYYITVLLLYWLLAYSLLWGNDNSLRTGFSALQSGVLVTSVMTLTFMLLMFALRWLYNRWPRLGTALILAFPLEIKALSWGYEAAAGWFYSLSEKVQWGLLVTLSIVLFLLVVAKELTDERTPKNGVHSPNGTQVAGHLPRIWNALQTVPSGLRHLFRGNWTPDLRNRIKIIYDANEKLKPRGFDGVNKSLADIANDFKAWNDAAKFLIAVSGGLAVVLSVFHSDADVQVALRILLALFLLVPGLSCVYMEVFRRRCERIWKSLEEGAASPNGD